MHRIVLFSTSALFALTYASCAHAQDQLPQQRDGYHSQTASDIVVTALIPRTQIDILSGSSVISGEDLTRNIRPTLGDTLSRQPGVSSTSYGPNASRPILRGFQGERVRILTDGIGSFDVSNTSVDHAVAINPLTAERIEVLRGPAALLYGSSAVGGVVNVIDTRIPRRVPDEPIHVEGIIGYGSAAEERSASGAVQMPLGSKVVVHLDGSYAKTGDLNTGSFILSDAARAQAAASDEAEIRDLATLRGRLPNTASRRWEVAGGLSVITDGGMLGVSLSRLENLYGVPSRYDLEEHDHDDEMLEEDAEAHGHENVRLNIQQTRADMRAEVAPHGAFVDSIRLRAGWADYQHAEIEEDGAIGTTFLNKSLESRLEVIQTRRNGWDGAFGGQLFIRNFNVIGEEKFLPKNETQQFGLFTLQSLDLGAARIEGGVRYEHTMLSVIADTDLGNPAYRRSFNALSASLGGNYALIPGWRIGLNLSRSERAPSAEELFARGNHAGTQAFELGNPDFTREKSWGVEGTVRGSGSGFTFGLSAFHNWFSDYIYETVVNDAACQAVNGGAALEFPCYQYQQADARYYGLEAEATVKLAQIGSYALSAEGVADYVRAKVTHGDAVPRIPPLRLLGALEMASEHVTARVEIEHSFAQKKVATFETTTAGFTLVNASVAFKPFPGNRQTSILLSANNIFNVEARRHASFLKDFAPLAGRDLRVTARFDF